MHDADTELREAAHSGDLDRVTAALAQGGVPRATDARGYDALLVAAAAGYRPIVEKLLSAGADVNAALPAGFNALHLVIEHTRNRPRDFRVTVEREGKSVELSDRNEIREATG